MACPSYAPEKNSNDVGLTTLYRLPSRECLYKVACPSYTPEKIPSIKWPVRVTPLKKTQTTLYRLPSRECLYKVACPSYTREKIPSMKWPVRVTPLKKTQTMLVGPLYTGSRAENASIKWPVRVTPLKKSLYKVACPSYASEKNPNDVGWTTLYRLPSRECLYKVAWSGYTREKKTADVVNDFDIDIWWYLFGCRFRSVYMFFLVSRQWDWWYSRKVWTWPLNFIQNHVDVSIDVIKNTIDITTIAV